MNEEAAAKKIVIFYTRLVEGNVPIELATELTMLYAGVMLDRDWNMG